MKIKNYLIFCVAFFAANAAVFAQQAKINAFSIDPSNLLEQLRQKKAENPKLSAAEFAHVANALLAANGLDYEFGLNNKICELIVAKRAQLKPGEPLAINAKFNQAAGEPVTVKFADVATNARGSCSACFVRVPLVSITDKDFVTKIQTQNINFKLPLDINLANVELVENQNLNVSLRRWRTPSNTVPLGVSPDGAILYASLPGAEFDDLALLIFDTGALEFSARKDLDLSEKPVTLTDFPKDASNPRLTFIGFGADKTKRTLKFTAPCN